MSSPASDKRFQLMVNARLELSRLEGEYSKWQAEHRRAREIRDMALLRCAGLLLLTGLSLTYGKDDMEELGMPNLATDVLGDIAAAVVGIRGLGCGFEGVVGESMRRAARETMHSAAETANTYTNIGGLPQPEWITRELGLRVNSASPTHYDLHQSGDSE